MQPPFKYDHLAMVILLYHCHTQLSLYWHPIHVAKSDQSAALLGKDLESMERGWTGRGGPGEVMEHRRA